MKKVRCFDAGLVSYVRAWRWQQALQARAVQGTLRQPATHTMDTLILCEHPSVFTLGRRGTLENLRFDHADPASPHTILRVDRGGEVTWHGPGQIVGYPVLNLTQHRRDLHWYIRQIEEVIIGTLQSFGIRGTRDDAGTGVWVGDAKIAAIGLSASRWVTMHGFALNVEPDLSFFGLIVPCGIQNRSVTSLRELLGNGQPSKDLVVATLRRSGSHDIYEIHHV